MVRKLLLLTFLAAPFLAAGCSTSDDDDSGDNCNVDADISSTCGGATGYSCNSGTTPDDDDPTRVCGAGVTAADGSDTYCCYDSGFTAGSCTPDDTTTDSCEAGSFGFICAAGDTDPSTQDSSLGSCSAPANGGTADLYCCTYSASGGGGGGVTIPTNCTAASDVTDSCGSGNGYACNPGTTPEDDDPTRICSQPTVNGGEDDFCCYDSGFTAGSCTPSDATTDACAEGTYGFTCAAGDTDPSTQDSNLSACSVPAGDSDTDFYCCTYN
jgi:hypothetical protein